MRANKYKQLSIITKRLKKFRLECSLLLLIAQNNGMRQIAF